MKKIYFLLLALGLFTGVNAQIITIPDANFKAKLLQAFSGNTIASTQTPVYNEANDTWTVSSYNKIDTNNNGEIEINEAQAIKWLDIPATSSMVSNLAGIENFTNLIYLYCSFQQLSSLNVSNLTNLQSLSCFNNQITSLNVSGLTNLKTLQCFNNQMTSLNVSGCTNLLKLSCPGNQLTSLSVLGLTNLKVLWCYENQLISLDVVDCTNLKDLSCSNNQLSNLFIKNNNNFWTSLNFGNNPNLQYICADEGDLTLVQNRINQYGYSATCHVNSYCSFVPGGTYYTIQGNNKFDENNNGCDVSDFGLLNLKFNITDGINTGSVIANISGNYNIPVQAGTHTITPVFENPAYFTASPSSVNVTFPTQTSPFTQNFCVVANGVHPDLEVSVLPIQPARPGFDAKYKLVYKNKGNTTQSGTINFVFNDAVLDFVSANPVVTTQTVNNLSWNFTNLAPFESREIDFTLNVNSPSETPAVNGGDVLNYIASVTSPATDDLPNDNTFTLNQTVVNSYDPNDKTCLEGATIPPSKVGEYVHYMIRFENNGTANAQNIVVKDMIDTNKYDINSLVPIKGSHSFVTNISAGNKVEFIFENINLPFDNANNDGYVSFKIKTKPTLTNGDTFSNSASIYFDYNLPIVTNTATTTIQALSRQDFEFSTYFKVYPNPVSTTLNIDAKDTIQISSINIYNTLGQLVLVVPNAQNTKSVDVSNLSSGNYFIKINSDKGTSNTKFIKQ